MSQVPPRFLVGGALIYVGISTATYVYVRSTQPSSTCSHSEHQDSDNIFDRIAPTYDSKINFDETLMGIKLLRRYLIKQAQGDVLEVSAGTARNLKYYDTDTLDSVTVTDASKEMVKTAYDKARDMGASQDFKFVLADAQNLCSTSSSSKDNETDAVSSSRRQGQKFGPSLDKSYTFAPRSFDTVVDTFGLCSQDDPVQALKEMAKVLKPGGQLLLLEHGRSSWDFLNNILDNNAQKHFEKWGCKWNKDILDIVQQAGLKVEWMSRWHFGSTYVISCRPTNL